MSATPTEAADAVDAGALADFPVGEIRTVTVGRMEVLVVQTAPGEFRAVSGVCPHKGARLAFGDLGGTMLPSGQGELCYAREHEVVRCPWHGYEFDLESGEMPFSDLSHKLRRFPVEVVDGRVTVARRPRQS
jgi:nitrite reductase (NADH) small subunit